MRFYCGPTYLEKYNARKVWHFHFCWIPRRCEDTQKCHWLEYVYRLGVHHDSMYDSIWTWRYRSIS